VPIVITLSVGYDGDPEKLREIMLQVAGARPGIEKEPAPFVNFDGFDADGIKLTLTAHATSGATSDATRTDMALAIHRAMRAAGIENSGHRHNVRLTDLEPIRQAVFAAMEERRRNMSGEGSGS
jgi:small-conductance mechanosensitive channel